MRVSTHCTSLISKRSCFYSCVLFYIQCRCKPESSLSFSREKETIRTCWTMFLLAKGRLEKHLSYISVVLMCLMCCILQEELCRWRMTWSYHSSCLFAPWSSASSIVLQNFSNLITVSFRITVYFGHKILIVHVMKADKELHLYRPESAISEVQSPPARPARRSQSKAKSRPPGSEVDLQLLKTLCQENDCNSEEV